MKWPRLFGWDEIRFGDRLKLHALLFQAGAGVAMTALGFYAMHTLAHLEAIWPVFYLGAGALLLVGIIVTGFASLLVTRTLVVEGPGGFKFSSQDQRGAEAIADNIGNITNVQRTDGQNSDGAIGGAAGGAGNPVSVNVSVDQRPGQGDQGSGQQNQPAGS